MTMQMDFQIPEMTMANVRKYIKISMIVFWVFFIRHFKTKINWIDLLFKYFHDIHRAEMFFIWPFKQFSKQKNKCVYQQYAAPMWCESIYLNSIKLTNCQLLKYRFEIYGRNISSMTWASLGKFISHRCFEWNIQMYQRIFYSEFKQLRLWSD